MGEGKHLGRNIKGKFKNSTKRKKILFQRQLNGDHVSCDARGKVGGEIQRGSISATLPSLTTLYI